MLGAPVGSFLFGIFDYQTTFFFFSGLVLGVWFMILIYIPNKLGADDAETDKNETPASPATALANNVFPVPGGPKSKTPFGIFAPIFVNFWGYFKNWTISTTSSLASSIPATLSNRI